MDPQLARRPSGLTRAELGEHRARCFIGQQCVLGSSLVVPGMVLWRAFLSYGQANGFKADPAALRSLLDRAPWAEVVERPQARGKLKSIVRGVGLKPTALPDPASGQ